MDAARKLSFVIPCFGSEHTILSVIDEIESTVRMDDDYEIVCVNDSSPDDVLSVLKERSASDKKVRVVSFSKNFGQHSALMAGYRFVTGDIVVSLDDDGQTPASDCYRLINALNKDCDVVYASYPIKKHSRFRNLGSKLTGIMSRSMMGAPKNLKGSSFFACKRFIVDEITKYEGPYPFIQGLILRATNKIGNEPIQHRARTEGESGYSFKKLVSLWLNGFTSFSVKPLRIASIVGFIVAAFGFIYGLVIIIRKLMIPSIAVGYSSMMAALLFIGGMIMIMLGMLGEYVGRAYLALNRAPQYVIEETINLGRESK